MALKSSALKPNVCATSSCSPCKEHSKAPGSSVLILKLRPAPWRNGWGAGGYVYRSGTQIARDTEFNVNLVPVNLIQQRGVLERGKGVPQPVGRAMLQRIPNGFGPLCSPA